MISFKITLWTFDVYFGYKNHDLYPFFCTLEVLNNYHLGLIESLFGTILYCSSYYHNTLALNFPLWLLHTASIMLGALHVKCQERRTNNLGVACPNTSITVSSHTTIGTSQKVKIPFSKSQRNLSSLPPSKLLKYIWLENLVKASASRSWVVSSKVQISNKEINGYLQVHHIIILGTSNIIRLDWFLSM